MPVLVAITVPLERTRRVTIDDLMALRTINDVKISPAGDRVAYTVSTPSVERNAHEAALFVIPATGGTPKRLAEGHTHLHARPAGAATAMVARRADVSVLVAVKSGPQVLTVNPDNERGHRGDVGAVGRERLRMVAGRKVCRVSLARRGERSAADREQGRRESTGHAARGCSRCPPARRARLTPPDQYVDSFSWSPDSKEIAYSFAPVVGFLAPYSTKIFAVAVDGGATRPIIDRPGMNVSPQFSPDGKRLSFITTNERTGIIAPRGLAVADAAAKNSQIRSYPMNGAWIAEILWAPDSQSLFVTMNEGTFATGAHMFEMPIVRVTLGDGKAERLGTGRDG